MGVDEVHFLGTNQVMTTPVTLSLIYQDTQTFYGGHTTRVGVETSSHENEGSIPHAHPNSVFHLLSLNISYPPILI